METKILIDQNTEYNLELVDVIISDLKFNPYNARIHSISVKILDENGIDENELSKLLSSEIQDKFYEGFINKYKKNKEYENLKTSILNTNGLLESKPIYITSGNLVLSGNTRLSILKSLMENGSLSHKKTIKAYKIKEPVETKDEIDILENHLQYFAEERVEYETFEKWMKIHSMFVKGNFTFEELGSKFNENSTEIEKAINTISEYYELLNHFEGETYISLYKELDISSVVQYLANDLSGKYTKEIRMAVKEMAYTSILTGFNWNKLRKVSNTYLGIQSKKFTNSDKINKINEINNEIIDISNSAFNLTKKLIKDKSEIKQSSERRKLTSDYDASEVIAEMQSEATRTKDLFDNTPEEIFKKELKLISASFKRICKTDISLKEPLSEIEEKIKGILNTDGK